MALINSQQFNKHAVTPIPAHPPSIESHYHQHLQTRRPRLPTTHTTSLAHLSLPSPTTTLSGLPRLSQPNAHTRHHHTVHNSTCLNSVILVCSMHGVGKPGKNVHLHHHHLGSPACLGKGRRHHHRHTNATTAQFLHPLTNTLDTQ